MSELNERYFGSDQTETPTSAAMRQAKQIMRQPPPPTLMERLLEQRTKEAVEGVRIQMREVVSASEEKCRLLSDALNNALRFIKCVSEGNANRSDAVAFLQEQKGGLGPLR